MNNELLTRVGLANSNGLTETELNRVANLFDRIKNLSTEEIDRIGEVHIKHLNDKSEEERREGYRSWETVWALDPKENYFAVYRKLHSIATKPPLWPEAKNMPNALNAIDGALNGVLYKDRISGELYNFLVRDWIEALPNISLS